MGYAPGTGVRWLDVTLTGIGILAAPLLFGIALFTHPGASLNPAMGEILLAFTVVGVCVVAIGVLVGRRTRWKVRDPRVPKTK
jgi:hypothetical protein